MDSATHNTIVNFIWNIADDVLRDVYVRGKYRDVILPMTVLRRLDCLLEPTKDKVLETHQFLEEHEIRDHAPALSKAAGYVFYNTSRFTFRRLLDEPSHVKANFAAYLDGFSENVQVIIEKFKLRNQIPTLDEGNRLYPLIQKFVSKDINLSPEPVTNGAGVVLQPGLSNCDMGYVFEELIRRFNEENNEEAGEHFTPRDIIRLMVNLILLPVKDQIESTTYLPHSTLYDARRRANATLSPHTWEALQEGMRLLDSDDPQRIVGWRNALSTPEALATALGCTPDRARTLLGGKGRWTTNERELLVEYMSTKRA